MLFLWCPGLEVSMRKYVSHNSLRFPTSSLKIPSIVPNQSTYICYNYTTIKGDLVYAQYMCVQHICIKCHGNHPVSQCHRSFPQPQSQIRKYGINSYHVNTKVFTSQTGIPNRYCPWIPQAKVHRGNPHFITGTTLTIINHIQPDLRDLGKKRPLR